MALTDILAIGTGIITFAYLLSRLLTRIIWPAARPKLAPLQIYGEVCEVPQELRPARKNAEGGSSGQGGRADAQHGSHFHVGAAK